MKTNLTQQNEHKLGRKLVEKLQSTGESASRKDKKERPINYVNLRALPLARTKNLRH